ncbi:DotG/IcmE/VirB10 family protein [Paucibacter soli]|uniref:DotG/IcmE/VirB10 family protein n=1 Tax=Paucibacter soli TaxID=3133433 RepID=UPI00309E1C09
MSNENPLFDDEPVDDDVQHVGNGPISTAPPSKLENVTGLTKNPKTRRVVIFTAGAVLVVGAIATMGVISKNRRPAPEPPASITGAAVGQAPTSLDETANPALAQSTQYQDIVAQAGAQRASEAAQSGLSTQPLAATVEASLRQSKTPAELEEIAAKERKADQESKALGDAQRQMVEIANRQAVAQGQVAAPTQVSMQDPAYQQMMQNAQQAILALSANRARGSQVFAMVDNAQATPVQAGTTAPMTGSQRQVMSPVAQQVQNPQYTLIAAGSIESARIDTAVNTDVGGDFVATLVTGRYAGAKLIGVVQRRGELAQMTCRTISFPNQGVSLPASCTVLDAETGEGGTATEVDRKLLTKYAIKPLAAGFAAVGDYLKNSGTTVTVNGSTTVSSQPELTSKKASQIVAGSAAQQVNTDANALDTTPTVRVHRGAVVGVVFGSDVVYTPKSK